MARILIIDDDSENRKLLRFRLEKSGYEVREGTNGEEALREIEREKPDLVFLDVRIPKVDGWQVCRGLKSNPETKDIPVVMLTGCSQDAQEDYGRQCGADDYVTKPWDARRVLDVTSALLKRRKE